MPSVSLLSRPTHRCSPIEPHSGFAGNLLSLFSPSSSLCLSAQPSAIRSDGKQHVPPLHRDEKAALFYYNTTTEIGLQSLAEQQQIVSTACRVHPLKHSTPCTVRQQHRGYILVKEEGKPPALAFVFRADISRSVRRCLPRPCGSGRRSTRA